MAKKKAARLSKGPLRKSSTKFKKSNDQKNDRTKKLESEIAELKTKQKELESSLKKEKAKVTALQRSLSKTQDEVTQEVSADEMEQGEHVIVSSSTYVYYYILIIIFHLIILNYKSEISACVFKGI